VLSLGQLTRSYQSEYAQSTSASACAAGPSFCCYLFHLRCYPLPLSLLLQWSIMMLGHLGSKLGMGLNQTWLRGLELRLELLLRLLQLHLHLPPLPSVLLQPTMLLPSTKCGDVGPPDLVVRYWRMELLYEGIMDTNRYRYIDSYRYRYIDIYTRRYTLQVVYFIVRTWPNEMVNWRVKRWRIEGLLITNTTPRHGVFHSMLDQPMVYRPWMGK